MGDAVPLEVVVQGNQVQANLLGDDVHRSATGQRRIHIHHAGIEAVAGIGCHLVLRFETIITLVPMAEADKVAMRQLTPLGDTRGARSVEQDEEALRLGFGRQDSSGRQTGQVLRQQHIALILIHHRAQLLIGYQQTGTRILHHEVQTLLWIARVERLVGTTGLQHTQRRDGHPLATRNQHRHHILQPEALGCYFAGDAVAEVIHLGIGVALALIDHSRVLRRLLRLSAKQRHDGLLRVVVHIAVVEGIQQPHLAGRRNNDVAQLLLGEESLHHSLIALQELPHQLLAQAVGTIFRLHAEASVADECLHIDRHLSRVVVQALGLHRHATKLQTVEQRPVPCKHRGSLQTEVSRHIGIGIRLMLPLPRHLLLSRSQEVEHRSVVLELGIDGKRPYQHRHRMGQSLVGSSVVNRVEQHLLLATVFSQQKGIGSREECALVDAVLLAEGVHAGRLHHHRSCQQTLLRLLILQVGQQG